MANGNPAPASGGPPSVPLSAHHGSHVAAKGKVGEYLPGETRFDYFFRGLKASDYLPTIDIEATRKLLEDLGASMLGTPDSPDSVMPTVYTYWGQFVDHDLTLNTDHDADVTNITGPKLSVLKPEEVAEKLGNGRLPQLNLDSVYGPGSQRGDEPATMRLGNITLNPAIPGVVIPPGDSEHDLPRTAKARALIGDARNDENLVIAQLHTAVLRFHNNAVRWVSDHEHHHGHGHEHSCSCGSKHACEPGCGCHRPPLSHVEVFRRAQDLTRLAYQWVTVHDFLPTVTSADLVSDALNAPRLRVVDERGVFMPLEFSIAAFRFGHSMIRAEYDHNRNFGLDGTTQPAATLGDLFQFTGGGGMRGLPTLPFNWVIEWDRWVEPISPFPNRHARKIDTRVSLPLGTLPGDVPSNLAGRNLVRGYNLAIPTGQAVAKALDVPALTTAELTSGNDSKLDKVFQTTTPLWFYVLKEAEVKTDGNALGPVGGRIVAETIVGQVRADPASYLNRWWTPDEGVKLADGRPVKTIKDFLRFAGVL